MAAEMAFHGYNGDMSDKNDKLLRERLTAEQACEQIAKLGGHLKQNGDPGWQILSRGYQDLLLIARGWEEAMALMAINKINH